LSDWETSVCLRKTGRLSVFNARKFCFRSIIKAESFGLGRGDWWFGCSCVVLISEQSYTNVGFCAALRAKRCRLEGVILPQRIGGVDGLNDD
jgi:hypothetical protein